MKKRLLTAASAALILGLGACTDLASVEKDSIVTQSAATGVFTGDAGELLKSAYNDLGVFINQDNIYSLQQHTSDEMIPPTRGTDWGDNGVWRTLDAHTWDANHAYVADAWNDLNTRIFKCSQVLASTKPAPTTEQAAEAKFLRAFYMYQIMDCFGQVPFRGVNDDVTKLPAVFTRDKAFDFIETDLKEASAGLASTGPKAANSTATKAAAKALLARLYINKAVYKASNPAGPYAFDKADMQNVITLCNEVAAIGYGLEDKYFTNFSTAASKEIIFTSANRAPDSRWFMTLHYSNTPSGWNGFTTLSDFYNKFEAGDQRKGIYQEDPAKEYSWLGRGFLTGQQRGPKKDADGKVIKDASGNYTIENVTNERNGLPLSFTEDVPLSGAASEKGIRVIKYHPSDAGQYILLRYADVLLMKAEAQFRSGDAAGALSTFNELRSKRGAKPASAVDATALLDERGRELYWEGLRRTDLVRFEKFTTSNGAVKKDPNTVLFPIPASAVLTNSNLRQNPGY